MGLKNMFVGSKESETYRSYIARLKEGDNEDLIREIHEAIGNNSESPALQYLFFLAQNDFFLNDEEEINAEMNYNKAAELSEKDKKMGEILKDSIHFLQAVIHHPELKKAYAHATFLHKAYEVKEEYALTMDEESHVQEALEEYLKKDKDEEDAEYDMYFLYELSKAITDTGLKEKTEGIQKESIRYFRDELQCEFFPKDDSDAEAFKKYLDSHDMGDLIRFLFHMQQFTMVCRAIDANKITDTDLLILGILSENKKPSIEDFIHGEYVDLEKSETWKKAIQNAPDDANLNDLKSSMERYSSITEAENLLEDMNVENANKAVELLRNILDNDTAKALYERARDYLYEEGKKAYMANDLDMTDECLYLIKGYMDTDSMLEKCEKVHKKKENKKKRATFFKGVGNVFLTILEAIGTFFAFHVEKSGDVFESDYSYASDEYDDFFYVASLFFYVLGSAFLLIMGRFFPNMVLFIIVAFLGSYLHFYSYCKQNDEGWGEKFYRASDFLSTLFAITVVMTSQSYGVTIMVLVALNILVSMILSLIIRTKAKDGFDFVTLFTDLFYILLIGLNIIFFLDSEVEEIPVSLSIISEYITYGEESFIGVLVLAGIIVVILSLSSVIGGISDNMDDETHIEMRNILSGLLLGFEVFILASGNMNLETGTFAAIMFAIFVLGWVQTSVGGHESMGDNFFDFHTIGNVAGIVIYALWIILSVALGFFEFVNLVVPVLAVFGFFIAIIFIFAKIAG